MSHQALVVIAPGCEELEAVASIDVLVRGGDLFEQGDLLGGHVEGFAIEAL